MPTMKALIIKSVIGLVAIGSVATASVVFKPENKQIPAVQGIQTETQLESEVETPVVASDTETKTETPTNQTSNKSIKVADLVVVDSEEEQQADIDQSKIKNVEQDAKLDDHEERIGNLENNVNNQPQAPQPEPEPTDTSAPSIHLEVWYNSWLSSDYNTRENDGLYGVKGLDTLGIVGDVQPSAGLDKMEYYLDGVLIASTMNFNSNISWNTAQHSDGAHVLSAKVYDKAGNVGTDSINIYIKNSVE